MIVKSRRCLRICFAISLIYVIINLIPTEPDTIYYKWKLRATFRNLSAQDPLISINKLDEEEFSENIEQVEQNNQYIDNYNVQINEQVATVKQEIESLRIKNMIQDIVKIEESKKHENIEPQNQIIQQGGSEQHNEFEHLSVVGKGKDFEQQDHLQQQNQMEKQENQDQKTSFKEQSNFEPQDNLKKRIEEEQNNKIIIENQTKLKESYLSNNKIQRMEQNGSQGGSLEPNPTQVKDQVIVYTIIICKGHAINKFPGNYGSSINRQFIQANVLLKSAATLTRRKIKFIVITNYYGLFKRFVDLTRHWPKEYKQKLIIERRDIWYPEGKEYLLEMFRMCATVRMFLHEILDNVDATIYIDTDMLFLRAPEDVWDEFDKFDSQQIAGLAPSQNYYLSGGNKVPFYGPTGLNAGVMHMNLTRMRQFPGGWTQKALQTFDEYNKTIELADQDVLNIIFSQSPALLYDVSCAQNYHKWQCTDQRNLCPNATTTGVTILHGNAYTFTKDKEIKFRAIFDTWANYHMGTDVKQLYEDMRQRLQDAKGNSICSTISGIDDILTKGLKNWYLENEKQET